MSDEKLNLSDLRKPQSKKDEGSTSVSWGNDGSGLAVFNGAEGVPGDVEIRALIEHVGKDPEDYHWEVVSVSWNSAGWMREKEDIREKHTAYTGATCVVKIKIEQIQNSALIKETEADIAALCSLVEKRKPGKTPLREGDRAFLWLWSDLQAGKGEGGGSPALVVRMNLALEHVVARLKELEKSGKGIDAVYIIGMGDLIESCEGHYCVAADTPILTDDLRWVEAGSLEVGDSLYSLNEDSSSQRGRRYEKATVLANKIELMDAVEITFSDGNTLVCTPEHPLLSCLAKPQNKKARWVQAKDLVPGEKIAKLCTPWKAGTTRDQGWMGGIYDGEGHFSAGSDRSGPNILGVAQKPGVVLDKMRECLRAEGLQFAESLNEDSQVASLRIRGGYPEVLRTLGTFRPERLIAKIGEPYIQSEWVKVVSVESIPPQNMARLGTSSHTYFANGYASHNSMQAFQVDLDRRQQCKLVRRLLLEAINVLTDLGYEIVIAAVPGNHGENRNSDGKAFTNWSDNDDVAVFEQVAEILAANPDRYHNVKVPQGALDREDLVVTLDIAGIPCAFAHGHQFKNGANSQAKAETWWQKQVLGKQPVSGADLLFSAHFHHFAVSEGTGRTWFQCPSIDGGSNWITFTSGVNSPAALLTMCIGDVYTRGWGDLEIV